MNPGMLMLVDPLSIVGGAWARHAVAMAWQAGLLVVVLGILDAVLARRVRAVIRYGLWMLLPVKLLLPPGLSLPTSPAYWLELGPSLGTQEWAVTVREMDSRSLPWSGSFDGATGTLGADKAGWSWALAAPGGWFMVWLGGVAACVVVAGARFRAVRGILRRSHPAPSEDRQRLVACSSRLGLKRVPELHVTREVASPAVCGLARPVILVPEGLADRLNRGQFDAVLLHELAHVKRGDLWINHLQALLQIAYWWHPLVWLGNARMRRVREEATDETAVVASGGSPDVYAKALVNVARSGLRRSWVGTGLGWLGILESARPLRRRVERLVLRPPPASIRWGLSGWIGIVTAGLLTLPMAQGRVARAAEDIRWLGEGGRVDVRFMPMRNAPVVLPMTASAEAAPTAIEWHDVERPTGLKPPVERQPDSAVEQGARVRVVAADPPAAVAATERSVTEPLQLVTRAYVLNPRVVEENLFRFTGRKPGSEDDLGPRILEFLRDAGFPAEAPHALFYQIQEGRLLIRTDRETMDRVDGWVERINQAPPQILIEAQFYSLADEVRQALGLEGTWLTRDPPKSTAVILSMAQANALRQALEQREGRGGVTKLERPRIVLLAGRQGSIESSRDIPGAAGAAGNEATRRRVLLEVAPEVEGDGTLRLTSLLRVTEFLRVDGAGLETRAEEPEAQFQPPLGAGVHSVNAVGYVEHSATNSVRLLDGQTVVVWLGEGARLGGKPSRRLMTLVTPRLIDPAGNPLHADSDLLRNGEVPAQETSGALPVR